MSNPAFQGASAKSGLLSVNYPVLQTQMETKLTSVFGPILFINVL